MPRVFRGKVLHHFTANRAHLARTIFKKLSVYIYLYAKMGLSKITEKIIFNKTIFQITAACTVFGILIYAYLTSMMNTRRFFTGDDLSGDFGSITDAEGFYGRAVNMVNVTAYHIKQRECLREGLQYSASRLEEERKSVKITLAFPKVK